MMMIMIIINITGQAPAPLRARPLHPEIRQNIIGISPEFNLKLPRKYPESRWTFARTSKRSINHHWAGFSDLQALGLTIQDRFSKREDTLKHRRTQPRSAAAETTTVARTPAMRTGQKQLLIQISKSTW